MYNSKIKMHSLKLNVFFQNIIKVIFFTKDNENLFIERDKIFLENSMSSTEISHNCGIHQKL